MIPVIKFKDEYHNLIISGKKTQTMRMPQSRIDVDYGDKVIATFKNRPDLLLQIIDTGYKAFKSINDEDAKKEGFNSADELKQELLDIYSDYYVGDMSRFYFYRFEFLAVKI